jgi:hypothetical protein
MASEAGKKCRTFIYTSSRDSLRVIGGLVLHIWKDWKERAVFGTKITLM